MVTLDKLPFDVLIEVLSAAQTVKDLYSLAFSSRSIYSVFQQYRLSLAFSILKAEVVPAYFRELLAILYTPDPKSVPRTPKIKQKNKSVVQSPLDYGSDDSDLDPGFGRDSSGYEPDFWWDYDDSQRHAVAVLQPHLDLYFSNQPFNDPTNDTHKSQILRVYMAVSRLADFCISRLTGLLLPASDPPNSRAATHVSPALSSAEKTRIQRAFLRYELYTRLFHYDKGKKKTGISATNQFRMYIGRINRREFEEIISIHQFLIALTRDYLVGFEEQLVKTLLTRPGVWRPPPPPPTPPMHHSNKKRGWSSDLMGGISYLPPNKCLRLTLTGTREYETMVSVDEEDLVGFDAGELRWRKKLTALYTEHLVYTAGLEFFSSLVHASSVPDGGKEQRRIFRSAQLERLLLNDYDKNGARDCLGEVLEHAFITHWDKRYYYHRDNHRLDGVRVPISQWRWLVREFPWLLRDKTDT